MMQGNRIFRLFLSSTQEGYCQCMTSAGSIRTRFTRRYASKWSLGTDRTSSSSQQRLTVIGKQQEPRLPMRPKDSKILGRERMLQEDAKKYESGRRWLAAMMGEDIETFDEAKIRKALDYLLPSHLFAKDARPMLKHPTEVYGEAESLVLDDEDRPFDAGFYTRQPKFHQTLFEIYEKREELATAEKNPRERRAPTDSKKDIRRWMRQEEVEEHLGEKLKEDQYELLMNRLKKLHHHDYGYLVSDFVDNFQVPIVIETKERVILDVDEDGTVISMGYRKRAIAEVKVKKGNGQFLINGKDMYEYFDWIPHRQQLMFPFLVTDSFGKFDVDAAVIGGGRSGQAGAIRLGISRALPSFDDDYYDALDEAALLIRDERHLERMKPGQKGARKKFAWVKR